MEYVGFWERLCATLIDTVLQFVIVIPLTYALYGRLYSPSRSVFMGPADLLINLVLPVIAVIGLWARFGATPGKMAMAAKIVDAKTGLPLTVQACVLRYLGYVLSAIPFGLGFIWIALDPRKQGWHDKLAHSVVIRPFAPDNAL
jgi:uncharacterized RDD family membrane protein YckC